MAVTRTKMTRTGWCIMGQCEGTRPKSASGKPMPTCTMWPECKCKCHVEITKMYEMAGVPRPAPEPNPEYKPAPRTYWMPGDPDPMPTEPLSMSVGVDAPTGIEQPVVTPPRAQEAPPSQPVVSWGRPASTPTGRKPKGQLEYEVLAVCADFVRNVFDWEACTPKLVSEEIGKRHSAEPPSTGAINAVWDRWEKIEFAEQAKKPSRFVKFLGKPTISALEKRKMDLKRMKRQGESAYRRGIRPLSR